MKFTCRQSDLTKALSVVSRAVTSRTTIPILKGILLNAEEDDRISLTASDLDISIETHIKAFVSERGAVVLPSKLFGDLVRRLPQGEVQFSENENGSVDIKCVKTEFKIMGLSAEEFPKIRGEMTGERIVLERNTMKEMIRKTCFAASTDETRGIITGVLLELKKGRIHMVALDGFRMAVVREETKSEEERKIIIPAGIMNEVGRIIGDTEEEKKSAEEKEGEEKNDKKGEFFDILMDDKKILFDLKNTVVVSRLLEGSFVKYEDILPKEYRTSLTINKEELREAVDRASVLIREGKNNFIKMEISEGSMILTSRNEEGSFRDEIATDRKGEDLEIGFNAKFITDTLKAVPDEEIRMEFNTSVTPCMIRPMEGNSYEYLVLPVRLASG
jgi:DNA polymerase-3 subunit beta